MNRLFTTLPRAVRLVVARALFALYLIFGASIFAAFGQNCVPWCFDFGIRDNFTCDYSDVCAGEGCVSQDQFFLTYSCENCTIFWDFEVDPQNTSIGSILADGSETIFEFSDTLWSWTGACDYNPTVSLTIEGGGAAAYFGALSVPDYSSNTFPCPGDPSEQCFSYTNRLIYTHPTLFNPGIDQITFRLTYFQGNDEIAVAFFNFRTSQPKIELSQLYEEGGSQLIGLLTPQPQGPAYDVAADGAMSLALRYPNTGGLFAIRNTPYDPDVTGALLEASLTDEEVVMHYLAPKSYDPDKDEVFLDYYLSPGDAEPYLSIQLNIKPPPVVLLHGLASDGGWWAPVRSSLLSQGWPADFIAAPDYDNDAPFPTQTGVVADALWDQISILRANGVFVNRANLVGYSMGGLLARQFLKNNPSAPVYKLITLNTPHSGSEWANLIDDRSYQGSIHWLVDRWFSNTAGGFDIDGGAMKSLRVDGSAILSLNAQPGPALPVHAISTDFTGCDYTSLGPALPGPAGKLSKIAVWGGGLLGFAYNLSALLCDGIELALGGEHDGIVRVQSQRGGLPAPYHQNYAGVSNTFHTATANHPQIRNEHLPRLLSADPEDSGLFTYGGFDPDILPPPGLRPAEEARVVSDVQAAILQPQPFDTVYAQLSPALLAEGSADVTGLLALYFFPGLDSMMADSVLWATSHSFGIPIPPGYEGWLNIGLLGTDGYGMVDFDTLSIFISQGAPPGPAAPGLTWPEDGSTGLPAGLSLQWEAALYAQSYQVEIAASPAFEELAFSQPAVAGTSISAQGLAPGMAYYWRVRAENISGQSGWSPVWQFTTGQVTGTTEADGGPFLSIHPNPAGDAVQVSCSRYILSLQLYDAQGRVVQSWPLGQPAGELELSGLPAGLYLLKAELEDGAVWGRVVRR